MACVINFAPIDGDCPITPRQVLEKALDNYIRSGVMDSGDKEIALAAFDRQYDVVIEEKLHRDRLKCEIVISKIF